jgi:hypothetical protein
VGGIQEGKKHEIIALVTDMEQKMHNHKKITQTYVGIFGKSALFFCNELRYFLPNAPLKRKKLNENR